MGETARRLAIVRVTANLFVGPTAGFVSPYAISGWMLAGFRNLTKSDFIPVGNLATWRATQNASLQAMSTDLSRGQWCPAETIFFDKVYANITQDYGFPFYNATLRPLRPGTRRIQYHATNLYPAIGASSAGMIFAVEEEWMVEALGYWYLLLLLARNSRWG